MMRRIWLGLLVLVLLGGAGARHFGNRALALEVDMDAVFRCTAKEAAAVKRCRDTRGIIINNCTVCHSFVPIVMQQFDANGWDSLMTRHVSGGRVPNLPADQAKTIQDYLVANFNPDKDPPDLPEELLQEWTSY
jgi:hypothetical protein